MYLTNHLLSVKKVNQYMPGPNGNERWEFSPSKAEMEFVSNKLDNNLDIPLNFVQTASPHVNTQNSIFTQAMAQTNPQTTSFCEKLGIDDPLASLIKNDNSFNHNISEASTCSLPSFLTPDKSDNLTHTSFINESDYENSFDPESPVNINSKFEPNSFTVKRESLTLPEPVHSNNEYIELEANESPVKAVDNSINEEEKTNISPLIEENNSPEYETSISIPFNLINL